MRIAINGFGRIGRQVFKAGFLERGFTVVAVNDLTPVDSLAYLLKYDTVYGVWDQDVKAKINSQNCTGKVCDLPFI